VKASNGKRRRRIVANGDNGVQILAHARARSRITNGTELLPGIDHRCLWARRFHDLNGLLTIDLGNPRSMSEAQRALVRRASALCVELELMEVRFARDGSTAEELEVFQRCTNSLRRLLECLNIHRGRLARNVNDPPDLQAYLNRRRRKSAVIDQEANVIDVEEAD
jgi:hypothetical protein